MNSTEARHRLTAEKQALEERLAQVGRRSMSVPNDWEQGPTDMLAEPDPIDQADAVTARANEAAILDALEARYDEVLAALKRVAQGTYGACTVCGELIARERLEANPSATTCAQHL